MRAKIMGFKESIAGLFLKKARLTDDFFDDLADVLVEGDFGAMPAENVVEKLRSFCKNAKISEADAAKECLKKILLEDLSSINAEKFFSDMEKHEALKVLLLLGVNGVGKTTTCAKLCRLYEKEKPVLAAADTFRAAAAEQLKIHGDRLGVRVVSHKHGGDPAAVIYDAIEAARAGKNGLVIADSAGRMHTKSALVAELEKIDRVIRKSADIIYRKCLVLDATTGRNALSQAEVFKDAVDIDAVILTKMDSSARGGIVWSLAAEAGLPVAFVGSGEEYGALQKFDERAFVEKFLF
jgi:fused signal recognition particle receptor